MAMEENFLYVRAENSGEDVGSLNDETFINDYVALTNLTIEDALKNMKPAICVVEMTQSDVDESSSKPKECEKEVVRENKEKEHKVKIVKQRKQKEEKKRQTRWFVGAHCRTKYSADNVVYEAYIIQINAEEGTCRIKYVGYNNEEDVKLDSLKLSKGEAARKKQFAAAAQYQTFWNHNENVTAGEHSHSSVPNDIFTNSHDSGLGFSPLPVDLGNENSTPHEDTEVMSAMLLSWYMSGYHTGYYQGEKDGISKYLKK